VQDKLDDDLELATLRLVHSRGAGSQRELASALGISLGKSNFVVRALLTRGWMKVRKFKASDNKSRYLYLLTPSGVTEKARRTRAFIKRKEEEYDAFKRHLEVLRAELDQE
jgi:EPS-associated MarR family transcriptional regulator